MGHLDRLLLVGRVSYYVGWIALLCGGLFHYHIANGLFMRMGLTQRNLFEVGVVCFIICVASELRALASARNEMPSAAKRQMAA